MIDNKEGSIESTDPQSIIEPNMMNMFGSPKTKSSIEIPRSHDLSSSVERLHIGEDHNKDISLPQPERRDPKERVEIYDD